LLEDGSLHASSFRVADFCLPVVDRSDHGFMLWGGANDPFTYCISTVSDLNAIEILHLQYPYNI
jgi:hypothetical protein